MTETGNWPPIKKTNETFAAVLHREMSTVEQLYREPIFRFYTAEKWLQKLSEILLGLILVYIVYIRTDISHR